MAAYNSSQRLSDYDDRSKASDASERNIWSSMLENVASGKRLPEKNILVLGGSSDTQKEFLESLSSDPSSKRAQGRNWTKKPPVANDFALGYTYHDVLDADHEDIIARLSVYLLADSSPAFTPLLQSLLTPETIPNTLIVILLDWSRPWLWLRQLRDWVSLLHVLLQSLSPECKNKMEEVMLRRRERGRGSSSTDSAHDGDVSLPLGPGEWDSALGLPLCVVCQNSDQMESLERERGWKEDEFDFVLQSLRTVLLKHGASLIYTIPSVPTQLQALIHSSLAVQSVVKKPQLKHNVIDRDKVVVPPNWDSWGKIRVLRDGFDVERVSQGWSADISQDRDGATNEEVSPHGAVALFEDTIQDPRTTSASSLAADAAGTQLKIKSLDPQEFLAIQLETLEKLRNTGSTVRDGTLKRSQTQTDNAEESGIVNDGRVNEHIGPIQFNMGGIQVDAEDMVRRLQDRNSNATPDPESPVTGGPPDGKSQNEALASFFAGLVKRGGGGSAANSPRPTAGA